MILRGTQIQREGHGRCGLLPNRTLSNNRTELPSPNVPVAHRDEEAQLVAACDYLIQEVAELVRL